jgi:hypothetical protein
MTPWSQRLHLARLWQVDRNSGRTRRFRTTLAFLLAACFAVIFVMLAKPLPFIVGAGEYAIVTDFGKPTQVVTSLGLRFRRAYESVRKLDRRLFVCASPLAEFDF